MAGSWRRRFGAKGLLATGLLAVALGVAAVPASAAPSNAPSSLTGTFDCGGGRTGTFVVNSGNSQATTWSPAFLTLSSGKAIFVPSAFHLTFSFNGQTFTQNATKGNSPAPTTCTIAASQGGFSLSGT